MAKPEDEKFLIQLQNANAAKNNLDQINWVIIGIFWAAKVLNIF